MSVKIVKEDCDPIVAQDRTLPYTAYLVTYLVDDVEKYDLVIAGKKTDIFDYYWDRYRENLIGFVQSEGRVNPKLWGYQSKEGKKK